MIDPHYIIWQHKVRVPMNERYRGARMEWRMVALTDQTHGRWERHTTHRMEAHMFLSLHHALLEMRYGVARNVPDGAYPATPEQWVAADVALRLFDDRREYSDE